MAAELAEPNSPGTRDARPDQPAVNKAPREESHMTKHDEARRAFLVGAAVGAGAVAGATLVCAYSITSSAATSNLSGTVRPSILAV